MADDKNLKGVYETLKREGYTPPAYEEFVKDMQDDNNLRGVHSTLTKAGYTPPAFEQFKVDMFGQPAKPATSQPQAKPQAQRPNTGWRMDRDGLIIPKEEAPGATQSAQAPQTPQTKHTQQVQEASESVPAPQPGWQPSEQEKIQNAYRLNSMMNEFNERSKKRVEQSRRAAERLSQQGRDKQKAMKAASQMAGLGGDQPLGITPAAASKNDHDFTGQPVEGQQTNEERRPNMSAQGPVPYGFVMENGERKRQWLLPDGSLTTDFSDADAAEYGARRVRLMNQFVERMKANGLDPSKQEDVQRQAVLDYEAPIRKAVASAVEADDKRSQEEHEAYMSNPANMIGGVSGAIGHAGTRKMAGIGDLNKIAETAFEFLPSYVRNDLVDSYKEHFKQHPEDLRGKSIEEAATNAAKADVYRQVHETYVERNAPKSATEFLARKVLELNPASVMLSSTVNPTGQAYADMDAMQRYGAEHRGLDIAGTVAGMAIDPTTYLAGGAGSWAFKQASKAAGRMMAKRATADVAGRLAATSLTGRMAGSIAAGGVNFATFEALKDAEGQIFQGGYINPETGEIEGFSVGSVLHSGVHGLGMGAATGVVSPLIGNVADKLVKASTSTAGKAAMRGGELLTSTVAEGTIFASPEIIGAYTMSDEDFNRMAAEHKAKTGQELTRGDIAMDAWTDNVAMIAGFKASHAVKTAPKVIATLRPAKPTNGRPLTREDRIHNNRDLRERFRAGLDHGWAMTADERANLERMQPFTSEEREELRRRGYGELEDLFNFDKEYESRRVNRGQKSKGDYIGGTGLSRVVDYDYVEQVSRNPEFDGYEAMERLMEDGSVSEATRAKAYYILTGRMLPMSTVTGWQKERNEDGSVTVFSTSQQGGVVTSRTFSNEEKAENEVEKIKRQVELNTIDIGEQFREAEAQELVLQVAIQDVSPGADPRTIFNIYEAVKRGDKDVTEEQKELASLIDEAIERNSSAGDESRPETIRERISKDTGVDVDKAIRKEPKRRSEEEKEAVKRYAQELFPKQEAETPSPEQQEADRIYDEGRRLFGRVEKGDPEAQAEVDATTIRVQEAYKMVEDAFGDEAEIYMAEVKEDPFSVLNNPELTESQKDAVLNFINVNAALDGVLDASNEAAAGKRETVQSEVERRTHKTTGMIQPATLWLTEDPVYIVSGDVVPYHDGTGIDVRNSSDRVIILDQTGEFRFVSPKDIEKLGEPVDPQTELQTAFEAIDREQEAMLGAAASVADATESVPNSVENRENGTENVPKPEENGEATKERNIPEEGNKAGENIPESTENGVSEVKKAPEPEVSVENVQQPTSETSALGRVPVDAKTNEPILTHESVDADTAWDAAQEFFGSEEDATKFVESQIVEAKNAVAKAEKRVGKVKPTGGMMKFKDDLAKARAKVEASKAILAKWEAIGNVQSRRKAEEDARITAENARLATERAATNAQRHEEAVAQFADEQRMKAEKEAEAGQLGTHAVHPKIKERWDSAYKVEGFKDEIRLPDGSLLTGHYVLAEAGSASASHDANNGFEPTEGFPVDKNGQSVNDRDYARDKEAQRMVQEIADSYDNRALQDPVVVSKEGIVLSGNNRTMSGDIAAQQGTDGAYLEYLNKYGHKFGFTPEQIDGMEHPRVLFIPDEDMPYDAKTFARFNAQEMKSQSKPEAAVKLGKVVPDEVFTNIVNEISRYDRLSGFYSDESAVAHTLGQLLDAGVINDKQMPELRVGTALSAAGKELIENTLIGKVFQASPEAVRQILSVPTLRESVVMGLSEIAANRQLSKQGYDLSKELADAIDLVERAKTNLPDVYKEGVPVSPFGRQQGLFDDEYGDSRVTDAVTLLLADVLNSGKPSDLRKVLALYNAKAKEGASGQYYMNEEGDLMPPLSKNEVLTLVNEHFRNATAKEQQKLVERAIEQRKREAEQSAGQRSGGQGDQQAEDALGRSERSEGRAGDSGTTFRLGGEASGDLYQKEVKKSDERTEKKEPYAKLSDIRSESSSSENGASSISHAEKSAPAISLESRDDGKNPDGIGNTLPTNKQESGNERPVLWNRGTLADSEAVATPTVTTIKAQHGDEHMGRTEGQSKGDFSEGKGNALSEDKQGNKGESSLGARISEAEGSVNTEPTEAQKEAGNYKKGHVQVGTFDITIENPKGSVRRGRDANGKEWETTMTHTYGYIRGTEAPDGDHIDVYLSSDIDAWEGRKVFVVDQYNPDGSFDEHKVMLGFNDRDEAFNAYLSNYEKGWEKGRRLDVTEANLEDFEKWIDSSHRKTKAFAEYKSLKGATETKGNAYTDEETGEQMYETKKAATLDEFLKGLHSEYPETEVSEESRPKLIRYAERAIAQGGERHTSNDGALHTESVTNDLASYDQSMMGKAAGGRIHSGKNFLLIDDKEGCAYEIQYKGAKHIGEPRKATVIKYSFNVPALPTPDSGTTYTITPTTYTNKARKTTPMHEVSFSVPLTYEQRKALSAFAREKADGKKNRGWCSDKETFSQWLFRTEEDARKAGEMIADKTGEAVADAQPLTAEDYQEAKEKKKKATPKPKNQATLQEIAEDKSSETPAPADKPADARGDDDLIGWDEPADGTGNPFGIRAEYTKGRTLTESMKEIGQTNDLGFDVTVGERYRYDGREIEIQAISGANVRWHDKELNRTFDEPAGILEGVEPIGQPKQFEVDDEMRAMEDQLRKLLGIDESEGDRGDLFRNAEEFTSAERQQITSLGMIYTLKYFDKGIVTFPEFAGRMVRRLGESIRPWLKAFYGGARAIPGYEHLPFTPSDEVDAFDVMNFDKALKDADPMRTAQGIVAEARAEAAIKKGQKEIKELRNQTRKENEKQIAANTDALAAEAETVASQAEATAESAKDEREIATATEKVDEALDKINDQLALLGYYEADPNAQEHEVYGLRRSAEKKAVKDAVKLAKQLVGDLGISLEKVTGKTTEQSQRSRGNKDTAVRANIASVGGDITINLPYPDGRNLHINIGLSPTHQRGTEPNRRGGSWEGDNYEVDRIMYRFEGNGRGDGHNHFLSPDVTYGKMLAGIQRTAKWGMPKEATLEAAPKDKPTTPAIRAVDVEGLLGAVSDAAAQTREDGQEREVKLSDHQKPEKKQEVKPEQSVGDLFSGLFDESKEDEKETELRPRTGTAEREEGYEPRQDEPLGTSQRNEDERPDRGGMVGRGGGDTVSDPGRGSGVSPVSTEHAVKPTEFKNTAEKEDGQLRRLPLKERRNTHNNVIKRGSEIAPTSEGARIKANIAALETLKRVQANGGEASPEDMEKLRAFSGWGGLGKAFSDWSITRKLRQLLGNEEYDGVVQLSRNSAYFTPGYVVDAMWDVARTLGFRGGNVLEGSAGIGNIIGLMPPELSDRSRIHAVEKETGTGSMLRLLYPDAKVDVQGFEETKIQNGSIDLAITNVPFVPGLKVKDVTGDADLSKRFKDIHNFCIAKNVRKLRDGGIGIFITTKGTLDSTGGLYNWLTNEGNADIVGLFRLHNETFGGTDATSDIIVVRKRVNGKKSPHAIDASSTTGVRTAEYHDGKKVTTRSMSYNRYFVEHPEHMAGEMKFGFETGNTYRPTSASLHPVEGKDQTRMLKAWVKEMGKKDFGEEEEADMQPRNHREEYVPIYDKAGVEVKTGSMQMDSQGRVCVNYDGTLRPLMSTPDKKNPKSEAERIAQFNKNNVKGRPRAQVIEDYNAIKKALTELLDYQKNNEGDEGLKPLIDNLNKAFDSFVGYYGNLHGNTAIAWLKNDVDYPSVLALETYREEGLEHTPVFGKADIFRNRVMSKVTPTKPQNVKDGVILSIRQSGALNVDYIAGELNRPVEEVKEEIISEGLGYENPTTHGMEPAHIYLSGNVREKLKLAEENNDNGQYDANITALRKVVPPSVPSHMIEFSIGSSWLDPKLFSDYVKDRTDLDVELNYAAGSWTMETDAYSLPEKDKSFGVRSEICNKIIPGHELIQAAMTNKTIKVSRSQKDGGTINDPKATQACANRIDEIREDFRSWLRGRMQQDEALAAEIETRFNDTFNNSAPMEIPDEYVPERFEGAATVVNGKPLKLRPHQSKAVVRGTMQSLMLAHEVGTGKTYTLITTAMEMRRLGAAKKPMIVVQNSTLGQFVASAKALYPDARILSLEEKDRNAEGRKDFYAKIRYNDWDMVVIPQSVLEKIDDHPDRKRKFIEDSIAEKLEVISQLRQDKENSRMISNLKKEVEKLNRELAELPVEAPVQKKKDMKKEAVTKENAKIRAQELLDRSTDDNLNFDDLGIDAILVDEAHEYKHLGFATAMQRGVKGVDPSPSKKCQGLFLKVKAVQERAGGRNVIFATGTPISNTAAEIWTFMRYLMPKEQMEAYNIYYFDDFVRNFGSIQQMFEYTTSGNYKEVNRFAGYNNLPELGRIWAGIADTVLTAEAGEVKANIPELEGGQPSDTYLPQTSGMRAVLRYVRKRLKEFEEMSGQEKKENSHIPLTMYGIAKAAAVDARLVSASAPDDPHSKTTEAVRQALKSLKETEKYNGTVAIFADNYQRKNKETEKVEFNLFEDIKQKLVKAGVPEDQIWIMNSNMTAKKKEEVFSRVNRGEIRVILGTTPLLGVGVNIQERLHTLMHLDAPNRPMDYWQRMGRLLRQGNLHKEMGIPVRVLRFGVEDSLDVTAYQRLKTKGAIADAVMNSKALLANNLENRVLEEEGDEFGQITAELSGSEYAILQNQTEKELRKLLANEERHRTHQTYIHHKIPEYQEKVAKAEARIEKLDETISSLEALPKEKTISIDGQKYKSVEAMEEAFKADNKALGELIERAENLGTTSTHTVRFTIDGKIHGEIKREVGTQMINSLGDMETYVNTTVTIPGIASEYHLKSRWLKANMKEVMELLDPERYKRFRENAVNEIAEYNRNIETLSKDRGKPFEQTGRIVELREKLKEYTQKLQEDLAEKEKKYAEMDKEVADLSDITFTSEDDETGDETSRLNRIADSAEEFDRTRDEAVKARGLVMPGLEDKEVRVVEVPRHDFTGEKPIAEAKRWAKENLTGEHELTDSNGNRVKYEISGKAIEKYLSQSATGQSDNLAVHLSALKKLPEIISESIEAEVHPSYDKFEGKRGPENGYNDDLLIHRFYGAMEMDGQTYRVKTTISEQRYDGTVHPHSYEVTKIEVIPEDPETTSVGAQAPDNVTKRALQATKLLNGVEKSYDPGVKLLDVSEKDLDKAMRKAVEAFSDKVLTPVSIISREEAAAEGYTRKKGWYDRETGKIMIVADNHRNVEDIMDTAVHETVGHHGLRKLFETPEKLNNFLDEGYRISSDKIRQEIDRRTEAMVDEKVRNIQERKRKEHEANGENVEYYYYSDLAEAEAEVHEKREQIRRDATEEYAADLGMKIGEEGFERMDAEELTFWGKLKGLLQKALDNLLAGLKLPKMRKWTDKEWSYVLWKSWRNLREERNSQDRPDAKRSETERVIYQGPIAEAEEIVRRERSNFGADESKLFRDADMGLEETITKMKADAASANDADFKAKQDAMKAIGEDLMNLHKTIAPQKEYDITTIKQVTDLAKIMIKNGRLGYRSQYEAEKILSAIEKSKSKKKKTAQVEMLMDILVNNQVRQAMGRQREYDLTTVKSMTDLAKTMMDGGMLDNLSRYETKRILSAVKNSIGGYKSVNEQVQKLMDIMVDNQLRMGANYFGKLLSTKGTHTDSRGIEIQGPLDPDGVKTTQVVKRAITRSTQDIENMMADALNRMGSGDQALADEAAIEYAGLEIARQYAQEIRESKHEEKDLLASIKEAEEEYKRGNMTHTAYLQYKAATEEGIRLNKIERAEAYRSLSERLGGVLGESAERAKAWRAEQKRRVEEIHHNANSDMQGRPSNEHHKETRLQKFANNGAARFLLAPLGTFDQMLRMFGSKSQDGEGYLWNRYMRGWLESTEKEYKGFQEAQKELDRKVKEIFSSGPDPKHGVKSWGDLFTLERKLPKATVRFWDGGKERDHVLTQGNLVYIYMADKMSDGKMKLRRMGIKEEDVERIKDFVDPRLIQLADWMQEEFLPNRRNKYNEVHKRMFGTSMAAIENYFPLKILANARTEEIDLAEDTGDTALPATTTGSIIKRTRNNLALDVTGADAFSVILNHLQDMERWAAFAEYNRDLNTLLSYKRFRNQVMNMTSAYGAGKTLWRNFRNVASMSAGAYRPPIAPLDKAAVNIAKGVTAAKVSFRVFTALKQFLSMPAYLSDSNPFYLVKNLAAADESFYWAMDNLPIFEKRWKSRMAGDPRLMKSEMDWKMWRSKCVEWASRVGMSPNAFVDALTVSIGARSMYETRLKKYKRLGYDEQTAEKRAKQDATILFNQTQQSSENAFLSTMQVDRSWLSVLFTVFRNSSMSYTRQLYDAVRNLGRAVGGRMGISDKKEVRDFITKKLISEGMEPDKAEKTAERGRTGKEYKNMVLEFMAKQMVRDGIDPDKADENAKREYRRGIVRDIARVGVFGWALQMAWNLGAYLPYLIFGENDDEKSEMWKDVVNHTMFGSVEGLTGGDVMSAAGEMWANGEGNPQQLTKDMPLASDVMNILKKMDKDYVSALNDVVNLMVQSGLGVNPQSMTDAVVAVMDYCGDDAETSRECALLIARILNCPQSQIDKIYFDEIDASGEEASQMTPEEIAERYAEYKLHRNAPLSGWLYSEEGRKKALDKHRKRAATIVKERMNSSMATDRTRELLKEAEEIAEKKKEINKLKKTDREAYRKGMKELRESHDMRKHARIKRYDRDMKRLTEKWQNAKNGEERDSLAGLMMKARERMLEDIEALEMRETI